jgi:acetyltransferase EpsM
MGESGGNMSMRPLVLIGGGEHANVLLDCARLQDPGRPVVGFIDPRPPLSSMSGAAGLAWLGGDDEGLRLARAGTHEFLLAFGGVGPNPQRRRITMGYEAAGARFATLIHPRATVAESAHIGEGTVIMAGAIVNPGAQIGRHCLINTGAIVEHDVRLGEHAVVGPGAIIGGGAEIGADSYLGLGSRVRDHIKVGRRVFLAMGAVLVESAPDDVVMWGVPARAREEIRAARA